MDRFVKRSDEPRIAAAPGRMPAPPVPKAKKRGRPEATEAQETCPVEIPAPRGRASVKTLALQVESLQKQLIELASKKANPAKASPEPIEEANPETEEPNPETEKAKASSQFIKDSGILGGQKGGQWGSGGKQYGCLGGRPEVETEGAGPVQLVMSEFVPSKVEPSGGAKLGMIKWLKSQLLEQGIPEADIEHEVEGKAQMTQKGLEFFQGLISRCLKNKMKSRALWRIWNGRKKTEALIQKAGGRKWAGRSQGTRGALRYQLHKNFVRSQGGGNVSKFRSVFSEVKHWFELRRQSGVHCCNLDLWLQFVHTLRKRKDTLASLKDKTLADQALLLSITEKEKLIDANYGIQKERVTAYMTKTFSAKLLKPQRVLSLNMDEEKARYLSTLRMNDFFVYLACFGSEAELGEWVINPQRFIKHRKHLVLSHSDQVAMWMKVNPGKCLFASFETQKFKKDGHQEEGLQSMQVSQVTAQLDVDPEAEGDDEVEDDMEGLTQKRGELASGQDKFRLTMDIENVCYNVANPELEPMAELGTVTVTMPGSHFDMSNYCPESKSFKEEEKFQVGTKEKLRRKDEVVHPMLAKSLRHLLCVQAPELYERAKKLNIRFFQQPAGYEDSYVCSRKLLHKSQKYLCHLEVKDLAGCQTSEACKEMAATCSCLETWIKGQMTAVMQNVDTDIAFRMKSFLSRLLDELKVKLAQLAEKEKAVVSFKCGLFEVVTAICDVVEWTRAEMTKDRFLLKVFRRNGWLGLVPVLSEGKLVKAETMPWCKDENGEILKEGGHRIRSSWLDGRYEWLTEEGKVERPDDLFAELATKNEEEQSYGDKEDAQRCLNTWKDMLKSGELSDAQLADMSSEPWFSLEVNSYKEAHEFSQEYKELMKTPKQLRLDLGMSEHATTQRRTADVRKKIQNKHEKYRQAMRPLKPGRLGELKDLLAAGYKVGQIAATLIPGLKSKALLAKWKQSLKGTGLTGKALSAALRSKFKSHTKDTVRMAIHKANVKDTKAKAAEKAAAAEAKAKAADEALLCCCCY